MTLLDLGSKFFSLLHRKPYKINESNSVFVSISSSSKSYIFLIHYYVRYNVIMIKDFSVVLLFSQRDDQEINIFFYFGTTFTTAWSREKKFLFSFHHYICYAMVIGEKKDFYCTLTMVRSWKNILVFYFTTTFTMQVSPYIYQLYSLRH